jgi:CRISPR-associated endonuclease/helicase Cas3
MASNWIRGLALWGKMRPDHPAILHMIDVGIMVQNLLETPSYSGYLEIWVRSSGCPRTEAKQWLGFLAACHDLGKLHYDFQVKGSESLKHWIQRANLPLPTPDQVLGKYLHNIALDFKDLQFLKDRGWTNPTIRVILQALKAHHGTFAIHNVPPNVDWDPAWQEIRCATVELLSHIFSVNTLSWCPRTFPHASITGLILLGLTVMGDWIASNKDLLPKEWPDDLEFWLMDQSNSTMIQNVHAWLNDYYLRQTRNAERVVRQLNLFGQIGWPSINKFRQLFQDPKYARLTPVQQLVEHDASPPGLVIIEAPMGHGKTETALYLAVRWMQMKQCEGLFIGMPTMAMSNQMFTRIQEFLNDFENSGIVPPRLVHGQSWLLDSEAEGWELLQNDFDSGEAAEDAQDGNMDAFEWFRPKKRALLSPYAVGTIDQALMAGLNIKYGFLRLFGLAGKIVVFDEVHAYDAYMNTILHRILQWLGELQVPVIMLSATLPTAKKQEFFKAYSPKADLSRLFTGSPDSSPYPLISGVGIDQMPICLPPSQQNPNISNRTTELTYDVRLDSSCFENPDGIAEIVVKAYEQREFGCICVLVNTVDLAQNIFRKIQARLASSPHTIDLFHARILAKNRIIHETNVLEKYGPPNRNDAIAQCTLDQALLGTMKRPKKGILVATQVVEQSLDLDFDELITEIAPMDLILQRMGRIYRHYRAYRRPEDKPRVTILVPPITDQTTPQFGKTQRVYQDRYILLKTWILLQSLDKITIPSMVRPLIEKCYQEYRPDTPNILPSYLWLETPLAKAWEEYKKKKAELTEIAKMFLIPEGKPTEFTFAAQYQKFQDLDTVLKDDSSMLEVANFFRANTRASDDSIQVICAETTDDLKILTQEYRPPMSEIRRLLLQSVKLMRYWLLNTVPETTSGYQPYFKAPKWCGRYIVLPLRNGEWWGIQNGMRIIIKNDPDVGIILIKETIIGK